MSFYPELVQHLVRTIAVLASEIVAHTEAGNAARLIDARAAVAETEFEYRACQAAAIAVRQAAGAVGEPIPPLR